MRINSPSSRFLWAKASLVAAALVAGTGVGIGIAVVTASSSGPSDARLSVPASDPGISWPAGARKAPDFRLRDQAGQVVDLRSLRGRPVIVTFIDPQCRNLCPLEAKVLNDAVDRLPSPSRPAIVAVSVNPWGQGAAVLRRDAREWHLVPEWRWALGSHSALAAIWKRYAIAVRVRVTKFAGITARQVDHTEAAYVIDPAGYERALFVFPYEPQDVVKTVRELNGSRS